VLGTVGLAALDLSLQLPTLTAASVYTITVEEQPSTLT